MSAANDLLLDGYSRIRGALHRVTDGLSRERLEARLDPDANSIGWLLWHLSRVQDDHVADLLGEAELWTSQGWQERFALPAAVTGIGYGHDSAQVGAVRGFEAGLVRDYYDAVHLRTVGYISSLTEDRFGVVVDESWDPPVTLGVRLVSVLDDCLEHVGQAAFVRGVLERLD